MFLDVMAAVVVVVVVIVAVVLTGRIAHALMQDTLSVSSSVCDYFGVWVNVSRLNI